MTQRPSEKPDADITIETLSRVFTPLPSIEILGFPADLDGITAFIAPPLDAAPE